MSAATSSTLGRVLEPLAKGAIGRFPAPRLGYRFDVTLGKMLDDGRDGKVDDANTPYLRAANIQDRGLVLDDVNSMPMTPAERAALSLEAGDLLVVEGGAVGTCHLLRESIEGWSFQKTLNRVRTRGDDSTEFLAYVLRAYKDNGIFDILCDGSTIPHLTAEKLSAVRVPMPPPPEQRAIADYLDGQTAKIDALMTKQTEMVRLLEERKRAVPAESLGRIQVLAQRNGAIGLRPVRDGWLAAPLRTLFDRKKDIGHTEEPMVSVFRERGVIFKDDAENLNRTAENRDIYQLVHPGWLLVNRMKAWQGSVGISGIRGITSGHYICFSPCHDADDHFLNALLRSPAYVAAFGMLSRGVRPGQVEIDNDLLGSLPVLLPPKKEQRAIAASIAAETARIDALIAKTREHIALANERRSALITAAVTGQFDVRTASSRGVA